MTRQILITDGTSQDARFPAALKDGYVNPDETEFQGLLAMGAAYARLLTFHNLNDDADGDWEDFFTSDEAVIMALILSTDLRSVETDFLRWAALFPHLPEREPDRIPPLRLALCVDFWFRKLGASGSPAGQGLHRKIADVIGKTLRDELVFLKQLLSRFDRRAAEGFDDRFSRFWFVPAKNGRPLISAHGEITEEYLRSNFYAFYNAIRFIQKHTEASLQLSLKSQTHSPGVGLYMAFLKLLEKVRDRANRFAQRHLDFYYDEVLQVRDRKFVPDKAHLLLTPDGGQRAVPIRKSTEFVAGKDENNRELIYGAENDLLVSHAAVQALYTLCFERDRLVSPETELSFYTGAKISHIPVSEEAGGELNSWPLFGAEKTEDTAHAGAEEARIGFAIASPVLLLKEGQRHIRVSFQLGPDLNRILRQVAGVMGTSAEDAFFKICRQMFTIALTGENGWLEVGEYVPSGHLTDKSFEEDRLDISFQLSDNADAVVAYSPELHGEGYTTGLPLIRFLINPAAYLYPYSLLEHLVFRAIGIEADVRGVRELLLYNNLGQLDPNVPFAPFGPLPSVGAFFIIGNYEMARKQVRFFEAHVEWGELPRETGGFGEYYRAYNMPFDNAVFEAGVSALRDGKWQPAEDAEQPGVRLFDSAPGGRVAKKRRLSSGPVLPGRPSATVPPEESFGFGPRTRSGFFRFTLSGPEYGFGHREYPAILTRVLTHNARVKHPRLASPMPNPPYTPVISAISVRYRATSAIQLDKSAGMGEMPSGEALFHIHPLGIERILPETARHVGMVPRYDRLGNLFIGLAAPEFSGPLPLFFHLNEDSAPVMDGIPPAFDWYYLAGNRWKQLDRFRVISDTTDGFLASGIVTLIVPEDIHRGSGLMPENLFWLRVSANSRPDAVCSAYGIHAQALRVRWQNRENALSHLNGSLPAGSIKDFRVSVPGIGKVVQITDSRGGRPPEDREHLKIRTGERLRHKNRALVPWDYERLILDRFPNLFKVKCFSHMSAEQKVHPGHVLIVVIPYHRERTEENLRPIVNRHMLTEIREFVRALAPPFAEITVRNPAYELIQVRCTVSFARGSSGGHYLSELNQAVTDYLSPWKPEGYPACFGWRIRRSDIVSYIRHLEYVGFVTNFSMLHITEDGQGRFRLYDTVRSQGADAEEIRPRFPWSIAIPARKHFIETTERAMIIEPEVTGIDELEIGRTFIIGT